jgi:hypothetical protein
MSKIKNIYFYIVREAHLGSPVVTPFKKNIFFRVIEKKNCLKDMCIMCNIRCYRHISLIYKDVFYCPQYDVNSRIAKHLSNDMTINKVFMTNLMMKQK